MTLALCYQHCNACTKPQLTKHLTLKALNYHFWKLTDEAFPMNVSVHHPNWWKTQEGSKGWGWSDGDPHHALRILTTIIWRFITSRIFHIIPVISGKSQTKTLIFVLHMTVVSSLTSNSVDRGSNGFPYPLFRVFLLTESMDNALMPHEENTLLIHVSSQSNITQSRHRKCTLYHALWYDKYTSPKYT